jgi:hypothetical protein
MQTMMQIRVVDAPSRNEAFNINGRAMARMTLNIVSQSGHSQAPAAPTPAQAGAESGAKTES